MDRATGFQRALDYIEENLEYDIDYERAARLAGVGAYHFQRIFSFMTGVTLGEYIRTRRLTLAAADIRRGMRVMDVAVKYGYESADSFARAFARFHGMPPSEARRPGARLGACSPLHIKWTLEGGSMLDYRIEHKGPLRLLGIRRRFTGAPYGTNRDKQEENLFLTTRASQWMLRGMSDDSNVDMVAIVNVDDAGYDCWYCADVDAWALEHLYDAGVTGIDFMDRFGFETLEVPAGAYGVFRTAAMAHPTDAYMELRKRVAQEWIPGTGYALRQAPELAVYHWFPRERRDRRFIEVWIPIEE